MDRDRRRSSSRASAAQHLGLVDNAPAVETGRRRAHAEAYPCTTSTTGSTSHDAQWIAANLPNVYPCGRNGMHKYNNQDHSMLTAMLSVENIGGAEHDVWAVNVEADYLEESSDDQSSGSTGRDAPVTPRRALDDAAAARAAEPKADAAGR
jgi:hypothetical protein